MRVTWYLLGVFIILTLGEIYPVSTHELRSNEGVDVLVNSLEPKPVIGRWKRYANTDKDENLGHKAKPAKKEKKKAFKKALEKKKDALKDKLNKKIVEVKEFIKEKKTVILQKKKEE